MDRTSVLFCAASLVGSLVLAVLLYPAASVPRALINASQSPVAAYEMEDLDLGEFGVVTVQELVDYYVENPPVPVAGGAVSSKPRFQGC